MAELAADIHVPFAWVTIAANAIVGIWALGAHWYESLRGRPLWWATGVAQVTCFVQVALGVAIVASGDLEVDQFHLFYGALTIIVVGILYSYRPQIVDHQYLLYGFGGLFIMGLALRAVFLDPLAG